MNEAFVASDDTALRHTPVRFLQERGVVHPRLTLIVAFIVIGIAASEILLYTGQLWPAIWLHLGTLLSCIVLLHFGADAPTIRALALVPLFRLVNLGMPVFVELSIYWFPLIYGAFLPALVFVDYVQPDLSVSMGWRPGLLLLPVTIPLGLVLAEVEFRIIESAALIPSWSLANMVLLTVVMVGFVGLVEEYLFRGIVQRTLASKVGRWPGLLVASGLFGMMHSGYGLPGEILFAGVIGLVFGLLYEYTDSLLLIAVAHGVLNVFLFGVLPIHGSALTW